MKNKFFETILSRSNNGVFVAKQESEQSLFSPIIRSSGERESQKSFSTQYNKDNSEMYVWNDYANTSSSGRRLGGNDFTLAENLYKISKQSAVTIFNNYENHMDYISVDLTNKSRNWIKQHGDEIQERYSITPQALEKLQVYGGYWSTDLWAIPLFQNKVLLNERIYAPGQTNKSRNNHKGTKGSIMVNYDAFPEQQPLSKVLDSSRVEDYILVCEGEKDLLTALSQNYQAISFTNGAGSLPHLYGNWFTNRLFAIVYDNDEAGIQGAQNLARYMLDKGALGVKIITNFHTICLNKGEDLNDFFHKYQRSKKEMDEMILSTPLLKNLDDYEKSLDYTRIESIYEVNRNPEFVYRFGEDIKNKTYVSRVRIESTLGAPKEVNKIINFVPEKLDYAFNFFVSLYKQYLEKKKLPEDEFEKWEKDNQNSLNELIFPGFGKEPYANPEEVFDHLAHYTWGYSDPTIIPNLLEYNNNKNNPFKLVAPYLRLDLSNLGEISEDKLIKTSYSEERSSQNKPTKHPFWRYSWKTPKENNIAFVREFIISDPKANTAEKPIKALSLGVEDAISLSGLYDVVYNVVSSLGQSAIVIIKSIKPLDNYTPIHLEPKQVQELRKAFSPSLLQSVEEKMDEYWEMMQKTYDLMSKTVFLALDLGYHSTLYNPLPFIRKDDDCWGTLDIVIIGDAGIGKTRTFQALKRIYKHGEKIDSENATDISLLGGTANDPHIGIKYTKVGALGKNNNGLIFLEEFSALADSVLKNSNSARSEKRLKISRMDGDIEYDCNVRWIAVTNPPAYFGTVADSDNGFQVVETIYKTDSQQRRVDLAIILESQDSDVQPDEFLKTKALLTKNTAQVREDLLTLRNNWVWGLGKDDIVYDNTILEALTWCANDFNQQFPNFKNEILGTSGNDDNRFMAMSLKISKIATACAAIQFSNVPNSPSKLLVTGEHIYWAYNYWLGIYDNKTFKLRQFYKEQIATREITPDNRAAFEYLWNTNYNAMFTLNQKRKFSMNTFQGMGIFPKDSVPFINILQDNYLCTPTKMDDKEGFIITKKFNTLYNEYRVKEKNIKNPGTNTSNSSKIVSLDPSIFDEIK